MRKRVKVCKAVRRVVGTPLRTGALNRARYEARAFEALRQRGRVGTACALRFFDSFFIDVINSLRLSTLCGDVLDDV